ncbi:hypothetical protein OHA45_37195 [Streptomyces lydicus]|uniref:hypothetical protein n=1 Tax=Streptomyces lydicus TaxID=47763 RepID=UPI002E3646A5|nr:hypothetical protein [Streptomyces lydicus]
MSTQGFNAGYLLPLFHAIEQARGDDTYRPLPAPAPASSLAADDAPLGPYSATHLIRNSYTAGLAHADALRRLTEAGEIDPTSPWTLLRGALENFATGLWLLDGAGRSERRRRALSLWDEDMRNRHQHEQDTGHHPSGAGRTGAQRREEIRDIADRLGLPPLTRPATHQILLAAAPSAGLTAVKVGAAWRAASGFAHGRYWPNLRASQPRAAVEGDDGIHIIALVIDEGQHRPLAEYCHSMLHRLQEHYTARAQAR